MSTVEAIYHQWIIVGIEVQDQERCIFIERNPDVSENIILEEIEKIKHDTSLCIEGNYIRTSRGTTLQIWTYISRKVSTIPWSMKLSGHVIANRHLSKLKDEWTLGKNNWRFEMNKFASCIFIDGIPSNSWTVFMPGSGNEETKLWINLWAQINNLFLIEWDIDKLPQLQSWYVEDKIHPQFISSYLGKWDESFSRELIESLQNTDVSILSLDTETSLTHWLLKDLAWVIENISINHDLFFMLNIVQRWSHRTAKQLLQQEEIVDQNIINSALEILPNKLLEMSQRHDIQIWKTKVGSYLGGSGTPMHYIFCHIQKI